MGARSGALREAQKQVHHRDNEAMRSRGRGYLTVSSLCGRLLCCASRACFQIVPDAFAPLCLCG
jgi:hypothetical protein